MMRKALIGSALLLTVGLVVLLYAGGILQPKKYLDPWERSYHEGFDDPRLQTVAFGLLAPSSHNIQPWRVRLEEDGLAFTLFVDPKRLLPEVDPLSRQIMVSQGTFLENVRIGAEELGFTPEIELFPEGEIDPEGSASSMETRPVARVALAPGEARPSPLYRAIFDRVTTRTPYLDRPLTGGEVQKLLEQQGEPGVYVLIFQEKADLEAIRDLAVRGVEVESGLPGPMRESGEIFRINEGEKNLHRDGLTLDSQGMPRLLQALVQGLGTIIPLGDERMADSWRKGEVERLHQTPAYAIVVTDGNSRTDQVRAGIVYQRLQLAGTIMGISMQPVSQVLEEYPEMEALYQEVHERFSGEGQTIQMLVRMGEAEKAVGHSPRRDVMDLIAG